MSLKKPSRMDDNLVDDYDELEELVLWGFLNRQADR